MSCCPGTTWPENSAYDELATSHVSRVPGTAVFLTRAADEIPAYITEYVRNMGSLHETVLALNIRFEEQPRIEQDRCKVEPMVGGLTRVVLRYGFMEQPNIPAALESIKSLPDAVNLDRAIFFGTRDIVVPHQHPVLIKWRYSLFAFLYRNAVRITDKFNLPPGRTIEVARQVRL